jgi:Protein of unknown function (DUF4244)
MRALFVWAKGSGQLTSTPTVAAALPLTAGRSGRSGRSGWSGWLGRRLRATGREAGMTTAEYAVGTVAACGFGGVLYKVLTSDAVVTLLTDILKRALTLSF